MGQNRLPAVLEPTPYVAIRSQADVLAERYAAEAQYAAGERRTNERRTAMLCAFGRGIFHPRKYWRWNIIVVILGIALLRTIATVFH